MPPPAEKKEITRLYVDGALVGRVEYREEGRNYVAKTYFDNKPVKNVAYFALDDPKPREQFIEATTKAEARAYFEQLAKRTETTSKELALILYRCPHLSSSPHAGCLSSRRA